MRSVDSSPAIQSSATRSLPPEAYTRMTLVLRLGLGIALVLLAGGLLVYLAGNPRASSSSVESNNPILGYLTVPGLASGLAAGSATAILTLGLLVLVATPILRVVSGLYYFGRTGERAMTAIVLTVLVLLLLGLLVIGPLLR